MACSRLLSGYLIGLARATEVHTAKELTRRLIIHVAHKFRISSLVGPAKGNDTGRVLGSVVSKSIHCEQETIIHR